MGRWDPISVIAVSQSLATYRLIKMTAKMYMILLVAVAAAASKSKECIGFKNSIVQNTTSASFHQKSVKSGMKTDYRRADVSWKPQDILEDPGCFNLPGTQLHLKTNHSDWQNTGATARLNKWTVDIKPCLQYHFKIVLVSLKGQTVKNPQLDLSQTLGPATQEQLKEAKYLPEVPTDFSYHSTDHTANLEWTGFDCTTEYFVTYHGVNLENHNQTISGLESRATITNLDNCTEYQVTIAGYGPSQDEDPHDQLQGSLQTQCGNSSGSGLKGGGVLPFLASCIFILYSFM